MKRREKGNKQIVWLTVFVASGIPACVKGFRTEKAALAQEKVWRKEINIDYDESGVFEVCVTEK
jgi:hypothetical protein